MCDTPTKVCSKCKVEKPISEFNLAKHGQYGVRTICKECRAYCRKNGLSENIERHIVADGFKVCSKCKQEKPINHFNNRKRTKDGLEYQCKDCFNKGQKEYLLLHKDVKFACDKRYRETHRELRKTTHKKWRDNTGYTRSDKFKQYGVNRRKEDVNYKLACFLRSRIGGGLKSQSAKKLFQTDELLGCSYDFLRRWLESQFTEGMLWNNWNYWGWHIDHIKPLASFDLKDPVQQKEASHYTNLQPLWAKENMSKGSKIVA